MSDRRNDQVRRALEILRSAPFSRVVNAFVLPSDTFYELGDILEGDSAPDEPPDAERAARAVPKKGPTSRKRTK